PGAERRTNANNFWATYLRDVTQALRKKPFGSTALDINLICDAKDQHSQCYVCVNTPDFPFGQMATYLAEQIDVAVEEHRSLLLMDHGSSGLTRILFGSLNTEA
ncbi:hypothetical protein FIBSPDRAFT_904912, partial [Athelia psychrophila]